MEQVFAYIIRLGAAVMMPILFTIIGLCIGMKFGKALKSGLYVVRVVKDGNTMTKKVLVK